MERAIAGFDEGSRNHGAAQQGVEADEALQTPELRSLTPVFAGQSAVRRAAANTDCDPERLWSVLGR